MARRAGSQLEYLLLSRLHFEHLIQVLSLGWIRRAPEIPSPLRISAKGINDPL